MLNKNYILIDKISDKFTVLEKSIQKLEESDFKEDLLGDLYEYINTLKEKLFKMDALEIKFKQNQQTNNNSK